MPVRFYAKALGVGCSGPAIFPGGEIDRNTKPDGKLCWTLSCSEPACRNSALKIQCPKSWPATVRSAMLHVVSLAQYGAALHRDDQLGGPPRQQRPTQVSHHAGEGTFAINGTA